MAGRDLFPLRTYAKKKPMPRPSMLPSFQPSALSLLASPEEPTVTSGRVSAFSLSPVPAKDRRANRTGAKERVLKPKAVKSGANVVNRKGKRASGEGRGKGGRPVRRKRKKRAVLLSSDEESEGEESDEERSLTPLSPTADEDADKGKQRFEPESDQHFGSDSPEAVRGKREHPGGPRRALRSPPSPAAEDESPDDGLFADSPVLYLDEAPHEREALHARKKTKKGRICGLHRLAGASPDNSTDSDF